MNGSFRNDRVPRITRYKYKVTNFKGIDAEAEESTLGLEYCTYGYNIRFENGILCNGIGINEPKILLDNGHYRYIPDVTRLNTGIHKLFLYKRKAADGTDDDRLIALGDAGEVYQAKLLSGDFKDTGIRCGMDAQFMNYRREGKDVLLVFSGTGGMYVYNGDTYETFPAAPKIISVCMHYERVYGTDGADTVFFSNDLDPTDWEEGEYGAGYIRLMDEGGKMKKVLSFRDYVYIFREHSIHRLTAYTDPSAYKITKVFETDQRILENTVAVTDDRILFLADNVLYTFDGYTVKRILPKLTALIENFFYAAATYFKNKYYLSVCLKRRGGDKVGDEIVGGILQNNGMIILDVMTGAVSLFRGADVGNMIPVAYQNFGALLCAFNNYRQPFIGMLDDSGSLFGTPLKKLWISPKTYLGSPDMNKVLRRLYLTSRYGVTVKTAINDQLRSVWTPGGETPARINYHSAGESIRIELETENNQIHVTNLLLEIDFARRYYAD